MDAALCIQGLPQGAYLGIHCFLAGFSLSPFFQDLLQGKQLITGDVRLLLGVIHDHVSGPENIHLEDAVMELCFRAAFVLHGDRDRTVRIFPLGDGHFIRIHGHGTRAAFFQLQHGGHLHFSRVDCKALGIHTEQLVFSVDRKFFRRLRFRSGFFRFGAGLRRLGLFGFRLRRLRFRCLRLRCLGLLCLGLRGFRLRCLCRCRLGRRRCTAASAGAESVHDQHRRCHHCQ